MIYVGDTSVGRATLRALCLVLATGATYGCTTSVSGLDTVSVSRPDLASPSPSLNSDPENIQTVQTQRASTDEPSASAAQTSATLALTSNGTIPAQGASFPAPAAEMTTVAQTIEAPDATSENALKAAKLPRVAETVVAQAPSINPDIANERILAASNAPTAGGALLGAPEGQLQLPAEQVVARAAPPAAAPEQKNRPGFLNALFRDKNATKARTIIAPPAPSAPAIVSQAQAQLPAPVADANPVVAAAASTPPSPQIQPGFEPVQGMVIAKASAIGTNSSLPGFDRKRALGIAEEEQPDGVEDEAPLVQLASAGGLTRLAPNGLRTQHGRVDVACLKPALLRVLKQIERHYGRLAVVTSGYRSPSRNAAARGAKNSLHMYCAAADIQVSGVSNWDLAAYVRTMPGRGGVGTYCHNESVHVDIGPTRDWNWRCRRKK